MSNTEPLTLTVKTDKLTLSPKQIWDLAGEFYGAPILAAGSGESNEIAFEFRDAVGPFSSFPSSAPSFLSLEAIKNLNAFMNALDSFKVP